MIEKLIEDFPYSDRLSPDEKRFLREKSSEIEYQKGKIISSGGTSCLGLIYLIKGRIRVYMISEEGREVTLFTIEPGDFCLLSASCAIEEISFETQMKTEEDCRLQVVKTGDFSSLAEKNIYVRCFMFETLAKRFSMVMKSMQQLLFEKIEIRVASWIISKIQDSENPVVFSTQEEIAQNINSAREVVTRTLKVFAGKELIEIKRGSIVVKNPEELKKILDQKK